MRENDVRKNPYADVTFNARSREGLSTPFSVAISQFFRATYDSWSECNETPLQKGGPNVSYR